MEIDFPSGHLGRSVSGASDLNADGIDDIIIGSSFAGSYIVFGDRNIGSKGKIDVLGLDGTQGFAFLPYNSEEILGHSVSAAGADPRLKTDNTSSSLSTSRSVVERGIAYVIYGSADTEHLHKLNLSQLNRQQGLILQDYGSYLGFSNSLYDNRERMLMRSTNKMNALKLEQ